MYQETEKIELKRTLNDTFEKELVAFLNTDGGKIILGVEDNGNIVGITNVDETLKNIADIITTKILPNPQEFVDASAKYEEEKMLIHVSIKKGNALYYIKKYEKKCFWLLCKNWNNM